MVRLSRSAPGGFTSLEGGPDGRIVLQMVDTAQADTVRAVLAAAFVDSNRTFAGRLREAELRPVGFSAADLSDWKAYLSPLLFDEAHRAGVTVSAVGADYHTAHVVVWVPGEAERAWVEARLARAAVPCGLVQTELGGGPAVGRHSLGYRRTAGGAGRRV